MPVLLQLLLDQFLLFVLILTRISGLVMTAPVFGARYIPMRIKGFLAIGLSLVVTPLHVGTSLPEMGNLVNLAVHLGQEAMVGLALGLGIMILFSGVQTAGQVVGHMSGARLADVVDPMFDESVPVYGQLMDMVTMAVFVIIGGHRQVVAALLDTFRWHPPGAGVVAPGLVETFNELITQSIVLGLRSATPAIIALLMSSLIMGLISRTVPQLNVLSIGFSLNAMVTIGVVSLTIGSVAWLFQDQVGPTIGVIRETFEPVAATAGP